MIGLFCDEAEHDTAQEFFELFKTPWEYCAPGRHYQVLIATRHDLPPVTADAAIIYGSAPTAFDQQHRIEVTPCTPGAWLETNGFRLPLYGPAAMLRRQAADPAPAALVMKLERALGQMPCAVRAGYDLFTEIRCLLDEGQPVEHALIPSLDLHIALLRAWIVQAGVPVVEIPPVPWGYNFMACLTHDVDFVSIRRHSFDHTFWGFLYRASVGSLLGFLRGKTSLRKLAANWRSVLLLPLLYLGVSKDFWDQFSGYAEIDSPFRSTFFVIPEKDNPGTKLHRPNSTRRAARYDIDDVREQVTALCDQGFEIGLHGIDAWHSAEKGRQERDRVSAVVGHANLGVRMHWLCHDQDTARILDAVGFNYDSTCGYNQTAGYRAGTMQVFRPAGAAHLLELPLHIQDTALFFPGYLALSDDEAWRLCLQMLETAAHLGGVLTILWHMRSLVPERLWRQVYLRLLAELAEREAWVGTAADVVAWFRQRRAVSFSAYKRDGNRIALTMSESHPAAKAGLFLRIHQPQSVEGSAGQGKAACVDIQWTGEPLVNITLQ